ncbi:MAG: LysR family transcriptional regulator [Clostridia bacterium]|nr:LysR family transcriptional regulator [Clostridia bacterium]
MEIQKLKYFYETAKLEHITQAAEVLHIAQPSLTQAIHALEQELDVPLFARQGRRVVLTPFGRHLKQRLDVLLPEFDNLQNELAQLKCAVNRTVKLNILAASTFVIDAIIRYKKKNPDVFFAFEQNELTHDSDIVITTNGLNTGGAKDYLQRCVKEEKIYLAVPKTAKYADCDAIDLRTVKDENFIMLSSTRLFGVICNRFCSVAGFSPRVLFESDSPIAVQNIISMGAGIAFWPEYSWGKLNNKNVVLRPIAYPICQRNLIIELHSRQPKSAYAEDFYAYLLRRI